MDTFSQRFGNKIKGVITGFDRIVFKGCIRPLMFAEGAMAFLRFRGVLNKDYKDWVMKQSSAMVEAAERYARAVSGRGIDPIRSSKDRVSGRPPAGAPSPAAGLVQHAATNSWRGARKEYDAVDWRSVAAPLPALRNMAAAIGTAPLSCRLVSRNDRFPGLREYRPCSGSRRFCSP